MNKAKAESKSLQHHCGLVAKLCPTLVTPWTVALQAPLSVEFSRQEYWSGLPFPPPGDFPNPGSNPGLLPLEYHGLCQNILNFI